MRRAASCLFAFVIFLLISIYPLHAQAPQPAPLVIDGGTLIDGNGGAPVRDAVIIVRGNQIESVSRKGQASYPAGAQVIHADGKFIVPGLMDAHVHYGNFLAELALNYGVTSVFDIAGRGPYHLVRREAIARGRMPGPRLFIAVESLVDTVKPGRVVYGIQGRQEQRITAETARDIVKRAAASRADMINLRRGMPADVWKAAIDEAHKLGLPVVGQPIGPLVWAKEAVLAGVDVLEHASGINYSILKDPEKWKGWGEIEVQSLDPRPFADMDDAKAAEMIRLLVDRKVFLEPDLVAQGRGLHRQRSAWELHDHLLLESPALGYIPAGTRQKWLANYTEVDDLPRAEWEQRKTGFQNMQRFIGDFAKKGGKVMTGTDTSAVGWAVAGVGVHHELELLVEAGLTPMQAIMAATRNPAEGYRVLDRVGTIEPGKLADMVIVNADPLQDIRNLQKIESVVKDGKVIERGYHASFRDPFSGDYIEALEWVESLKRANTEGIRTIAGLTDPNWIFGQPCPGIESLSLNMVTEGGPSITVTLHGINFTKKSLAYFGGVPVPARLVSETELQITVDAGLLARPGIFPITVKNPGPLLAQPQWGDTSNKANFVVNFK